MPLLSTRGAASARGFGFGAGAVGGPPTFITMLTDANGGSAAPNYANAPQGAVENSSGDVYVGWRPNSNGTWSLLASKLNSSGTLQWHKVFNPNNVRNILSSYVTWNNISSQLIVSGSQFTGSFYRSAYASITSAGSIAAGGEFEREGGNNFVDSSGNIWLARNGSGATQGSQFQKYQSNWTNIANYNLYFGSSGNQRAANVGGVDSSGNMWGTMFEGTYDPNPRNELIRISSGGTITSYACNSALGFVGFYTPCVSPTYVYVNGGNKIGRVTLSNPTGTSTLINISGLSVTSLVADASDNLYIAGSNSTAARVAKISSSLNVVWALEVTANAGSLGFTSISISNNGNYLLLTCTANSDYSGYATTIKIPIAGNVSGPYTVTGTSMTLTFASATVSLTTSTFTLSTSSPTTGNLGTSWGSNTNSGSSTGFQNYTYP